jgi:hypothetical protein
MSRLKNNSIAYRDSLLAKNPNTPDNEYAYGHPDTLSDGDEKGRGPTTTIGTSIDIAKRNELLAKNLYSKTNAYNISNA